MDTAEADHMSCDNEIQKAGLEGDQLISWLIHQAYFMYFDIISMPALTWRKRNN